MYFTLTAYLNSDAKFSLEILGLHLNFIKLTIKQCLPYCIILSINKNKGPGQVVQLVGVLSQHTKVAGSISGQGTYKKQPMNA